MDFLYKTDLSLGQLKKLCVKASDDGLRLEFYVSLGRNNSSEETYIILTEQQVEILLSAKSRS